MILFAFVCQFASRRRAEFKGYILMQSYRLLLCSASIVYSKDRFIVYS